VIGTTPGTTLTSALQLVERTIGVPAGEFLGEAAVGHPRAAADDRHRGARIRHAPRAVPAVRPAVASAVPIMSIAAVRPDTNSGTAPMARSRSTPAR
jgi:hypothetical protein